MPTPRLSGCYPPAPPRPAPLMRPGASTRSPPPPGEQPPKPGLGLGRSILDRSSSNPMVGRIEPMRPNPKYASSDFEVVQQLIRENPWGILVSSSHGELVASHYPILLDEQASELTVLTHVGRPDEKVHGFGDREMLLIVQGRHGYISPSWYVPGTTPAPTWNFSVAHCYGVPQILDKAANMRVLTRLVEHFERHVEQPMLLDQESGAQLAKGTVGIRLPITRFVCKLKLSQDKDPVSQRQVMAALRAPRSLPASRARRRHEARTERSGRLTARTHVPCRCARHVRGRASPRRPRRPPATPSWNTRARPRPPLLKHVICGLSHVFTH